MSNWKEIWNGKKISDDIIDLNKMSTEQVFLN